MRRSLAVVVALWAAPLAAQHPHVASGIPHGIPDFCANPTIVSVAAGDWANGATWNPPRVPVAGDLVDVRTSVTYGSVSDAALRCVSVSGTLAFRNDVNTRLTVGTLMPMPGGLLQVGTPAAPIQPQVTAEIVIADRPLDTTTDPDQYGTGLIGLGKTTIVGAQRTPFARLTSELQSGATSAPTDKPLTGWRAGDNLVIPDSRHVSDAERNPYVYRGEEPRVASVNGAVVSFQAPLQFFHEGARDQDGVLKFLPHVANVTRNVVIRSANPTGTRGHVFFATRAEVDIRYAAFVDLGRTTHQPLSNTSWSGGSTPTPLTIGTNQFGRYPLHFHHVMGPITPPADGYQYKLIGNAIVHSRKWGITIHNSHWGLIQANVIYDATGSGVMTEDGNESFNVIEGNFVARVLGPGGQGIERGMRDIGWEGTGYWLRGVNNIMRDNIAASIPRAHGFTYMMIEFTGSLPIPNFRGADTTVSGQYTMVPAASLPIREDTRSEAYGAFGGFTWWWVGTVNNAVNVNVPWSLVKDARAWHIIDAAVYNYQANKVWMDGLVLLNKRPDYGSSKGFRGYDYLNRHGLISNANIQGFTYGYSPTTNSGNGSQVLRDSYLRNGVNIKMDTLWTSDSDARKIFARKTVIRNVTSRLSPIAHPGVASKHIMFEYQGAPTRNVVQRDELLVYGWNGNTADHFRAYWPQQASGFIVPATQTATNGIPMLIGSPTAGLTNQQAWGQHGVAIGGAVTPCTTARAQTDGFACSIPWADPSMDGLPPLPATSPIPAPAPPTNVGVR